MRMCSYWRLVLFVYSKTMQIRRLPDDTRNELLLWFTDRDLWVFSCTSCANFNFARLVLHERLLACVRDFPLQGKQEDENGTIRFLGPRFPNIGMRHANSAPTAISCRTGLRDLSVTKKQYHAPIMHAAHLTEEQIAMDDEAASQKIVIDQYSLDAQTLELSTDVVFAEWPFLKAEAKELEIDISGPQSGSGTSFRVGKKTVFGRNGFNASYESCRIIWTNYHIVDIEFPTLFGTACVKASLYRKLDRPSVLHLVEAVSGLRFGRAGDRVLHPDIFVHGGELRSRTNLTFFSLELTPRPLPPPFAQR